MNFVKLYHPACGYNSWEYGHPINHEWIEIRCRGNHYTVQNARIPVDLPIEEAEWRPYVKQKA